MMTRDYYVSAWETETGGRKKRKKANTSLNIYKRSINSISAPFKIDANCAVILAFQWMRDFYVYIDRFLSLFMSTASLCFYPALVVQNTIKTRL